MNKKNYTAFSVFFQKFPQLLLAGAIFSAALTAFVGIFVIISYVTGFSDNIFLWGFGLIPATLFYPGLVMVVRKYAVEKSFVPVISTFFKAVKDNFKAFILHGFAAYIIFACGLFAALYYFALAKKNIIFGYVMTTYVMFTLVLLMMLFYVPLMSVTYELRYRDIYKNSIALVFNKIGRNLLTLIITLLLCAVALGAVIFLEGAVKIICAALIVLLYPLIITYIVTVTVSKPLQDTVGSFVPAETAEPEEAAIPSDNTEDDYIFINGKMVKNPNKK